MHDPTQLHLCLTSLMRHRKRGGKINGFNCHVLMLEQRRKHNNGTCRWNMIFVGLSNSNPCNSFITEFLNFIQPIEIGLRLVISTNHLFYYRVRRFGSVACNLDKPIKMYRLNEFGLKNH